MPEMMGAGCAIVDIDNDGDLDLFVANYGVWSPELESQIPFRERGRAGRAGKRN